jgi:hypothetical protein
MKESKLWCSGTMPRSLPLLIGLLLLCGCAEERCDKEIGPETAVRIAREYFLSRSIAQLESGTPAEREEARVMRRAGMTEKTYRETFQLAEPGRARRVGNQFCGHPYIFYQVRPSLIYDGFDVIFIRVVPGGDVGRWRDTVTGVNVTKCGRMSRFYRTYNSEIFNDPKKMGFGTCP